VLKRAIWECAATIADKGLQPSAWLAADSITAMVRVDTLFIIASFLNDPENHPRITG